MVTIHSAPRQAYFTGKANLTLHSEHKTRSDARAEMNRLRHIDGSILFVIYDGKDFVSSTF